MQSLLRRTSSRADDGPGEVGPTPDAPLGPVPGGGGHLVAVPSDAGPSGPFVHEGDADANRPPLALVDAAARPVGASAKGNVERIEDGILTGWMASADDAPLREPVTVWLNGRRAGFIDRTLYREDLARVGIAGGHAGFSTSVRGADLGSAGPVEIALSTGPEDAPRVFLRHTLTLGDHRALNPNPYLRPGPRGTIGDWRLDHDRRAGVLLDSFPMSEGFRDVASRYTRLTFPDPMTAGLPLSLRCPVALNRDARTDLSLALLLRADRSTEIDATLRRNGVAISEVRFVADGGWNRLTRPMPGTVGLEARDGAQLSLELSLAHRGGGFVDFGFCYLAEDPSARYLRRVHRDPSAGDDEGEASTNFVDNGDFDRWSRGVRFDPPREGRETADGWWIEGDPAEVARVRVCADVAGPRAGHGDASGEPRFGLRVAVGDALGSVRLVAAVDRRLIDGPTAGGELVLDAPGPSRTAHVRRVSLRATGLGREAVARAFAGRTRVRGRTALALDVDEASMVGVRRACVGTGALHLVLELEPNSELLVAGATLGPGRAPGTADVGASATAAFEDPSIAEQIPRLKGLEDWLEDDARGVPGDPIAPSAEAAEPAGSAADLSSFVVPEVRRPHVGYPSVDIVVPVHNALDFVQGCVRSVIENTTVPYGLILVDDGSDRTTRDWLREVAARFPNVTLVVNERNLGYTRTVNRGLERSMADHVCVLNSDCVVTPDWLPLMIDCARHASGIGMVGPLSNAASFQSVPRIREGDDWCLNPLGDARTPSDVAALVRELSEVRRPAVRVLNGFCQLISREALDAVGTLDEEAFPTGFGEENDFCARLVAAGFTLHVVDDAYVFHAKSKSFGHERRRALSREGAEALARKHPHVDWKTITGELESSPPLVRLRDRLAAELG